MQATAKTTNDDSHKKAAALHDVKTKNKGQEHAASLVNNRPEAATQQSVQRAANNSPMVVSQMKLQTAISDSISENQFEAFEQAEAFGESYEGPIQRVLSRNPGGTRSRFDLAPLAAVAGLAAGDYLRDIATRTWYRYIATHNAGLIYIAQDDGTNPSTYNLGTGAINAVNCANGAQLIAVAAAIGNVAHLLQLFTDGASGAQLATILAIENNGATVHNQIGAINGNNVAHLTQLYADGATSAQITVLLGVENNGATLHNQIGAINGNNVAHLIQLYADGASSAQITAMLAHENNGTTIHNLIGIIHGNNVAHLLQLYVDGANSGQINTLLGHEANGNDLHQIIAAVNASAANLIAYYNAGKTTAELQRLVALGQVNNAADLTALVASARPIGEIETIANNAAATPAAAIGPLGQAATAVVQVAAGAVNQALLTPVRWGLTLPEDIQVNVTAHQANGHWYGALSSITGRYSKQIRLLAGVQEVTGPGGNTNGGNYAAQVGDLRATTTNHGNWYMYNAVDAHESVHEMRMAPALTAAEPRMQAYIASLSVPVSAMAHNQATAAVQIIALPGFQAALQNAYAHWLNTYAAFIANDHGAAFNGPSYVAEHLITNPMILAINAAAAAQHWGPPA